MSIDDRDEKIEAIRKSLSAGSKPKASRKPSRPAINIQGDQNIIGDGNVIHLHRAAGPAKRPVKTGDGVIDAAQKSQLKSLVDDIVSLSRATHAATWSRFNRTMRVNSYHEIVPAQFEAAKARLLQWRASSRKTSANPSARKDNIGAIQARWKQEGSEAASRAYMMARFGLSSLTELSDEQCREVYNFVFKSG